MKELKFENSEKVKFEITLKISEIKDLLLNDIAYLSVIFNEKSFSKNEWLFIELIVYENTKNQIAFFTSTEQSENYEFFRHFAGFKNVRFHTELSEGEEKFCEIRYALHGENLKDNERIEKLKKIEKLDLIEETEEEHEPITETDDLPF